MLRNVIKQKIISRIFSIIPFSILGKITQTNLIIPYYHVISDDEVLHIKHLYAYKNIKQFKDDIEFLLKNYTPIDLFDLLNFLKTGQSLPEKAFLLTFDDGFREMHDIVAPILLEKGVPASFFINSAFIDNKNLCYQHKTSILVEHLERTMSLGLREKIKEVLLKNELEFNDIKSSILSIKYRQKDLVDEIAQLIDIDFNDYLVRNKPYLTSDQIKKLIKDGFTIGAHSIDHPLYSSISLESQLHQTIESVKLIREKFCLDYGAFAFPHSDNNVSKKFFVELYNSGLVDISFGTGGMIKDCVPNNLQRFSLEKPLMPAERIIAFQFARKLFKLMTGNDRIIRK
ncbi:MAG: polysaccharide deacetylase family protein [Desulfobacterales bacterium]|nr:polysaccharide deacetylase family protein [Desulfobacterales bacterium]